MKNLFNKPEERLPRAVIFVSGTGTNAEKAIEQRTSWEPAVIVTDVKGCPAAKLAERFSLPLIEFDIADFYHSNGEDKVSLRTERGRELREQWTEKLREMLREYKFEFGLLAGFKTLSNITNDFPCLNVHPGDLTREKDGKRLLTGLHASPIEKAILHKHDSLRSCVILALPYSEEGNDMDSGIILGVSHQVPLVLQDYTLDELESVSSRRIPGKQVHDELRLIAEINLEHLKYNGDWIVFPPVVNDFAAGRFVIDDSDNLYYIDNDKPVKVKTVEYDASGNRIPQLD